MTLFVELISDRMVSPLLCGFPKKEFFPSFLLQSLAVHGKIGVIELFLTKKEPKHVENFANEALIVC